MFSITFNQQLPFVWTGKIWRTTTQWYVIFESGLKLIPWKANKVLTFKHC